MINTAIHNRFQAFFIHLVCSAMLASFVVALVYWIWYPGHLATATGVTKIFLTVLIVDVTLGPLLTLVVYNPKKPGLRRDLFIIVLLQISALLYGLYTVGIARPVYIVFAVDRFELVYANDLTEEKLAEAPEPFQSIPFWGQKWAIAKFPEDEDEKSNILFSAATGGDDLAQLPRYYHAYQNAKSLVIGSLLPLSKLKQINDKHPGVYEKIMDQYTNQEDKLGYLPLQGRTSDLTVLVDKQSAEVIQIVNLQPW